MDAPMKDGDTFSGAETARRRDAIVRNMIATPLQNHAPLKVVHKKRKRPKRK